MKLVKIHEEIDLFEDLKQDQIVFSLPLSPMACEIVYPDSDYSFSNLIDLSNSLSNKLDNKIELERQINFQECATDSVTLPKEHKYPYSFRGGRFNKNFQSLCLILNEISTDNDCEVSNYNDLTS